MAWLLTTADLSLTKDWIRQCLKTLYVRRAYFQTLPATKTPLRTALDQTAPGHKEQRDPEGSIPCFLRGLLLLSVPRVRLSRISHMSRLHRAVNAF